MRLPRLAAYFTLDLVHRLLLALVIIFYLFSFIVAAPLHIEYPLIYVDIILAVSVISIFVHVIPQWWQKRRFVDLTIYFFLSIYPLILVCATLLDLMQYGI